MKLQSAIIAITAIVGAMGCQVAAAASGGAMPSMPNMSSSPPTPQEQAAAAYNVGVKLVKQATDQKAEKAAKTYAKALDRFSDAVKIMPGMYEAWNYIGFTQRHLGHFQESLDAYDRALTLKPDYAEAIEYRGEAYLGLNRIDDAKAAYMTLFGSARNLADQLLVAMTSWLATRRADAGATPTPELEAFGQWVQERGTVAAQTASLGIQVPTQNWQ